MARDTWVAEMVDDCAGGDYDPALYRYAGEVPTVDKPLAALAADDFAWYRSNGYLAVATACGSDLVADALAGVDVLISGAVPGFRGIQWEAGVRDQLAEANLQRRRDWVRKLIYFVDSDERLAAVAYDPQLLRAVGELLGDEPELFADQALLKPPGLGREKPWHQDKAFFDVRPGAPVVGVWIALDRATPENGCMHLIPNSHLDGPVVHFNRRDLQICDTDVDRARIYSVPLQPGGALFFDGLLHHGTPANNSGSRRWALQFHYAAAAAIWRSPEERARYRQSRFDLFGADGKDVTC